MAKNDASIAQAEQLTTEQVTSEHTSANGTRKARNDYPIVNLLKELASGKFIDWSNETVFIGSGSLSNADFTNDDMSKMGVVVTLEQFIGSFSIANLTTLRNANNPRSAEERKLDAMVRLLKGLGMHDATEELIKKFADKAKKGDN